MKDCSSEADWDSPGSGRPRDSENQINLLLVLILQVLVCGPLFKIPSKWNAAECTFFINAHVTFSKIDHMLGHNTNLNKFRRLKLY